MTAEQQALHSLAYVSQSTLADDPPRAEAAIRSILHSARRNNARRAVTGVLIFTERGFAQVLEGERAAVEDVFEAIVCDSRHHDVTVLYSHPVEARSFAAWAMAYVGPDIEQADHYACALPEVRATHPGKDVLAVLLHQLRRADLAQPAVD